VGIFSQIGTGEAIVRERCIIFLQTKMKNLGPEIINLEFEKTLLSEISRVFKEISPVDQKEVLSLLVGGKLLETVSGQQAVVDLLVKQLDMNKNFDASEPIHFEHLFVSTRFMIPMFSVSTAINLRTHMT